MDLTDIPLIDHHCHGVLREDLDQLAFESLLNEASGRSRWGTTLFDSMLGLAVRRWCAPKLDLEEFATPEEYIARRNKLGFDEVNRRFVGAAGISDFIVDTGFDPDRITSPADLAAYAGGTGHEIIRLEQVAEELITGSVLPQDFDDQLRERLSQSNAIGAKSIAAYRVGLDLAGEKPEMGKVRDVLAVVQPDLDGTVRLAHPVMHSYLAWTAIEVGLPLQFHVGYGDNDVDLANCDPLKLTGFLRATQDRDVPVLLLHNYPFHRNAAYLAQVFWVSA